MHDYDILSPSNSGQAIPSEKLEMAPHIGEESMVTFLTVRDIAARSGLSEPWIHKLVKDENEKLKPFAQTLRGHLFFTEEDVDAFVQRQRRKAELLKEARSL